MFQKDSAFLGLLALALFASACSKDDSAPDNTPVNLSATINATQQVPTSRDSTVTSAATGTMTGTYTPSDRVLKYTITYQGFRAAPVAGHFHLGAPGANGANFVTLPNVGTSPITGTATFTQAQADALLANGVYVNLHTPRYSNGEIRGNIKK